VSRERVFGALTGRSENRCTEEWKSMLWRLPVLKPFSGMAPVVCNLGTRSITSIAITIDLISSR
jgi:hypothetical protein